MFIVKCQRRTSKDLQNEVILFNATYIADKCLPFLKQSRLAKSYPLADLPRPLHKTSGSEIIAHGILKTPQVEFLRNPCTKNLPPYKARWIIAAHAILKISIPGVSIQAHRILKNYVSFCAPCVLKTFSPNKAR